MTISQIMEQHKTYYYTGATRGLDFRLTQLKKLRQAIIEHEKEIIQALRMDLNKGEKEAYAFEIGIVYQEISHAIKHLKGWMKPKKVKSPQTHTGSRSYIIPEPLGTALIIAPWNYPFMLAIDPLVGAIAAGNTVVLKPSELAPAVSSELSNLLRKTFDPQYVAVVEGGLEESRMLLEQPFDKIFFTGSVAVGKVVMEAAAKRLTRVTLELGGKSPCIVHHDAQVKLAAQRIAFGKFSNAGQTCVAPDYVLVHRSVKDKLLDELKRTVVSFYGEKPLNDPDYGKIVSRRHYERLRAFLQDGTIAFGGASDDQKLQIEPTVLDQITWAMPVMQEEIFGPILPVLTYDSLDDVVTMVNARPKPLAFYVFSEDKKVQDTLLERVPFGGGCVNDTLMHFGSSHLPVGGVGESGMGSYHGEMSFQVFSHMKSILKMTTRFDLPFRYPSSKIGLKIIRMLTKP
ncbi:aldehyde dehydrogenase [Paenibacillus roseipurpureus]|uniref:Aldehyde dehydrogenase n=1 Tax=Paenibacillus roseopurpureus TaxID=2918901 RepID=A0AA96RJ03_9BACL|nr:aldehyde dehydrogenase [Paenibacillus sp. MBLB1832]WNR42651.1 aldehyde dehydrogenase [Paenibacillus sp. MBLB1832]